jgi:hypothetical protein
MSESFVNQVNLDYLMNKEHARSNNNLNMNTKEKRFYRKRIMNVTKELLSIDSSLNVLPDVRYAFENYVQYCIHYFKGIDNNDIIQEEYKDYKETINNNTDFELDLDKTANLFMRTIKIPKPSLDKFVKKGSKEEPMFIPQQKEIDLSNPLLKNKGICKKKNKKNIYEKDK